MGEELEDEQGWNKHAVKRENRYCKVRRIDELHWGYCFLACEFAAVVVVTALNMKGVGEFKVGKGAAWACSQIAPSSS